MKGSDSAKAKSRNPRSEPDGRLTDKEIASTARSSELSTLNRCQSGADQLSTAQILGILHKWGIHTLGQLAALNKEELRTRLGPDAVRLWERANGTATRLLKLVQPPETFIENYEFDHEIETAEPLLFILRRFLEQLALRLSSIYLVARELTLTITFRNKETHSRVFKIPQPTNEVDLLFRMLQTHLENPAAAGSEHPIVAVALSAEPSRPASQQFGLFETALRNPHQLYETLARLIALVGNDRVGTPVIEETHRPDAFRMEPFDWRRNDECRISNVETKPALRRFRPPARASIFISDGRHLGERAGESEPDWHRQSPLPECRRDACRHRRSDKVRGQIIDQTGPFLLSGNWWDEKAWARAEWDMQLKNGDLIRAHESAGVWEIDGIYD